MNTTEKQPVFLRIIKDGKLLEMKQFKGQQIVMGREGNVDLIVADASVSPIHAMIEEREEGRYFLCDLGSQSGTFLKGHKIVDEAVETGTEFQVGLITIEFHIGIPRPKKVTESNTGQFIITDPPKAKPPSAPPMTGSPAPSVKPLHSKPVTPAVKQPEPVKVQPPKVEKTKSAPFVNASLASQEVKIPKDIPKASSLSKSAGDMGFGAGLQSALVTPGKNRHAPQAGGTFAPSSSARLNETIKPSRGNVVEIVVAWKDRVLDTYHFINKQTVQIGSHPNNDIILPVFGSVRMAHPLVRLEGVAKIFVTSDMTGEVVGHNGSMSFDELKRKGDLSSSGTGFSYTLQQDEVFRINFGEGVQIIIRYVTEAPASKLLPLLDMSVNHLTSLIVGMMGITLFLFYTFLYAPPPIEKEEGENVPPRRAQFVYKRPAAEIKPETVAKASGSETIKDKEVAPARGEEGASAEAKPNKSQSKKKKLTADKASKDSGIQKNKGKSDAAAKSVVKDVTKSGMLSVFGNKGIQDQLNKAYKGSGNVAGLSQTATGQGGEAAGSGNKPGSGLREVGAGGQGTATVGISGVKTKGRGGGVSGYGTGSLGAKKNASIIAGGDGETFSGSIDKEAIRRVVQANIKQIKACYERGLNKDPGLYGKIVIQWTIGPGGNVLEAGIKSTTMNSSAVENCAVGRLKSWKFPEPPANEVAVVSYPFLFESQD